jgi:hypothetical protein
MPRAIQGMGETSPGIFAAAQQETLTAATNKSYWEKGTSRRLSDATVTRNGFDLKMG